MNNKYTTNYIGIKTEPKNYNIKIIQIYLIARYKNRKYMSCRGKYLYKIHRAENKNIDIFVRK